MTDLRLRDEVRTGDLVTVTLIYPDIDYVAVLTARDGSVFAHFKVYPLISVTPEGEVLVGPSVDEMVSFKDATDAQVFASGSIKWDGCSNFRFDEQDRCMLHGCDREYLVNVGQVLARVHDEALALIEVVGERARDAATEAE